MKFAVSVVMVKEEPWLMSINTQNKLYIINAISQAEAHGLVLEQSQKDFPKHRFHTICSVEIEETEFVELGPNATEKVGEVIDLYGAKYVVVECPNKQEDCEVLHTRPLQDNRCPGM